MCANIANLGQDQIIREINISCTNFNVSINAIRTHRLNITTDTLIMNQTGVIKAGPYFNLTAKSAVVS